MSNESVKYKKSLVSSSQDDWQVKRLGDLCDTFKSGFGITSEKIKEIGDYAVFGGNGLRGYTNTYTHSGKYLLIGRQGALCGNIIQVDGMNYVSEHAIAVKANENNCNSFLAYKLEFINLNRLSESSAQPGLSVEKLVRIRLNIPALPEQKKIATILSTWDAAIDNCKTIVEKLKERNKGLAQQLLTGKKRANGNSGKWKKEMLEKYLVKHDEKSTINNQYPVLTSSRRGIFFQSDYYTRDVASEDNTGYNVVPHGFFTYRHMSDDLIFKFNVNDIVEKGIVSTLYPVFTNRNINKHFLLYKLNQGNEFKIHAMEQKQGGSRTYIYFKSLCELKIDMPSLEEQSEIVSILQTADIEVNYYQQKLESLQLQKKGLMQQLLTGKTRVKI